MADPGSRAGASYANEKVLKYVEKVHGPHDAALDRAYQAPARTGLPAIQLGVSEARLLELLVRMAGAKKVVEVGTLCGYSAIRIARGLAPGGHVWTCEKEERNAEVARENLAAAGLSSTVEVVVGAARDTLPTLEQHGPFDLVFIDADKGNYDHYGRWAAQHLRKGGLLVGDNSYYFGRLTDDEPDAAAMRRFHEEAAQHFDSVCAPTPDGMVIGIKR